MIGNIQKDRTFSAENILSELQKLLQPDQNTAALNEHQESPDIF